jgi:amidase
MSGIPEYTHYDGLGLAELVRKKDVKPSELVEAAISRIEQHNPQLNAVIYKLYEQARVVAEGELPDGPFRGVPFLLKDLVSTYAGAPMHMGSRFFQGYVPAQDDEIIKRYKASGVVIVGKTNTPEFGLSATTEPELYGPTRNPWDPTRTAGGSSGGSAAAVAAGMTPLAGGGDGAGSIRIPASCCGLFGLKPTRGRTPAGPRRGERWQGFTVEHVLTRSVRDSATMLDAIAAPDPGAPYVTPPPSRPYLEEVATPPGRLRIAFTTRPFLGRSVHPECTCGVEATAKLLAGLGHNVVEDAPLFDGYAFAKAFLLMVCVETAADIREAAAQLPRKPTRADFEAITWALHLVGSQYSAVDFVNARRTLHQIGRQIGRFFTRYDLLLTPTLAEPPVPIGALDLKGLEAMLLRILGRLHAGRLFKAIKMVNISARTAFEFLPYTPIFNVTGQPAMSVPLHWSADGLPVGMHFAGRFGEEATLFRLAGQLEQARPWFQRTPFAR